MLRAFAVLTGVVACLTVVQPVGAGVNGSGHGSKASKAGACREYGSAREGRYTVRDDYWRGHVCVTARRSGFTVTRAKFPANPSPTYAFPNIFTGCEWGVCTPSSGLPARVAALRKPQVTVRTSGNPAGGWSAAVETWFSKHRLVSGQANQAELMVWLRARWYHASHVVVRLGGVRYYVAHWIANHGTGTTWNYIQFRRVGPVTGVTGLKLEPFIRYAIRHGWIKRSSWIDNVEAGFELRAGGRGLAVTRFAARP
jgi:cellulose 1,4-beta-cellobiosidase